MNCCESAIAFNDEAAGERSMTMSRGCFIGHDQLETGINGIGSVGSVYLDVSWVTTAGGWQISVPRAGFTSIRTRRSACFSVMSSPARNKLGRILSYSQTCG